MSNHALSPAADVLEGGGISKDWRIYDVGGHRSQVCLFCLPLLDDWLNFTDREVRIKLQFAESVIHVSLVLIFIVAAWVPFFDDMDAIIFLAPIRYSAVVLRLYTIRSLTWINYSAFDQMLEEDPKMNRLVSHLFYSAGSRHRSYLHLLIRSPVGFLPAMVKHSIQWTPQSHEYHPIPQQAWPLSNKNWGRYTLCEICDLIQRPTKHCSGHIGLWVTHFLLGPKETQCCNHRPSTKIW